MIVTREYIKEKLDKAKRALEDAEVEVEKLQAVDTPGDFIRIDSSNQVAIDTEFAINQLKAVMIHVGR